MNRKLKVAVPDLPSELTHAEINRVQRFLLQEFMAQQVISDPVLWYYTPTGPGFHP